jgi:hypothetical protein
MSLPTPLPDLPTDSSMPPLGPEAASPVLKDKTPDATGDSPELTEMAPLGPIEFGADPMLTRPLPASLPPPLPTIREPPTPEELDPALITM